MIGVGVKPRLAAGPSCDGQYGIGETRQRTAVLAAGAPRGAAVFIHPMRPVGTGYVGIMATAERVRNGKASD
jgi:hypothetical protein